MSVCWVVRTVPERAALLADTLVVVPDALVVCDEEHRGVTWSSVTGLRQALAESAAAWVGVLADDFRYCPAFAARLGALTDMTTQDALVLYSQARPGGRVVEEHGDFALRRRRAGQLIVAPVLRRAAAELLLAALDARLALGARRDFDGVGARVLHAGRLRSAVVWPNPVDHIGIVSALGNTWTVAGRPRVSAWSCAT